MDGGILMETLNRPAVYKDKTAYMKQPECKLFLLRPFSTWGGLAFLLLQALTTFLQDMEMVAQLYCLCVFISLIYLFHLLMQEIWVGVQVLKMQSYVTDSDCCIPVYGCVWNVKLFLILQTSVCFYTAAICSLVISYAFAIFNGIIFGIHNFQ